MKNLLLSVALCIAAVPGIGMAKDISQALKSMAVMNVLPWLDEPAIIEALKAHNAMTADYDQARIDALDLEWRATVKSGESSALVDAVIKGPVADFFRKKYKNSGGMIVEVILMDNKGLNVAASRAPSDYWQADEPKFQNSFGAGPTGVDTGEVEYDASSNAYAAQISYPVPDPETGELLGAITVGLAVAGLD